MRRYLAGLVKKQSSTGKKVSLWFNQDSVFHVHHSPGAGTNHELWIAKKWSGIAHASPACVLIVYLYLYLRLLSSWRGVVVPNLQFFRQLSWADWQFLDWQLSDWQLLDWQFKDWQTGWLTTRSLVCQPACLLPSPFINPNSKSHYGESARRGELLMPMQWWWIWFSQFKREILCPLVPG